MRIKGPGVRPRHADDGEIDSDSRREPQHSHGACSRHAGKHFTILGEKNDEENGNDNPDQRMQESIDDVEEVRVAKRCDISAVDHQK